MKALSFGYDIKGCPSASAFTTEDMDDFNTDLPDLFVSREKTFVLFRGPKRVQFRIEDLNVNRLESIFKVDPGTLYLEDECRKTFFPLPNGKFDTENMRHLGNYAVEGDSTDVPVVVASPMNQVAGGSSNGTPFRGQSSRSPFNRGPTHFQNPRKRTISTRKQIYLAEVDTDNKPTMTGMQFWKSSAKKILAMKTADFLQMSFHREKNKSGKKRSASARPVSPDSLKNIEVAVEEVRQEMAGKLSNIKETLIKHLPTDLSLKVDDMKSHLYGLSSKLNHVEQLQDKLMEVREENNVVTALKNVLSCKICLKLPPTTIALCSCCSQFVACGECMQEWVLHNDCCILCKQPDVSTKIVFVEGLDTVLNLMQDKAASTDSMQ